MDICSKTPPLSKKALQEEPSSLQKPANIMQIQICNQADTNFAVKISGIDVISLYDMGFNMSCISYPCYTKLIDPPSLKIVPTMSVHSATGYDLCPIGIMCCKIR